MINGFSHVTCYVLDQEAAKAFYTEKLGFVLNTDAVMGDGFEGGGHGFRWLTVSPPGRPDLEIILADPAMGNDDDTAAAIRVLVAKGALSTGVLATDDVRKTYEELSARGVEFLQEPVERPYGTEAILRDDSGNWFSLTQHTGGTAVIRTISVAILAVGDQDVMRDFFVTRLGFTVTTDAEMWPGARWLELAPSGGGTGLVLNAASDFGREPDGGYPMTFAGTDLAGMAGELRAAGVPVEGPTTEPWGTFLRVTDPEGRQLVVSDRVPGES